MRKGSALNALAVFPHHLMLNAGLFSFVGFGGSNGWDKCDSSDDEASGYTTDHDILPVQYELRP